MRVLVVSQYFPPESAVIQEDVAQELIHRGHSVRVLTGYPNYPEGRVFDGYRQRWRSRERQGDVEILRVPLYADHSQSASRRVLNYLSFGLSSASARSWARGADVIYVYATQMTAALGPWIWRSMGGAPYLLHVQDLWPDSITGSSMVKPGRGAAIIDGGLTPWLANVYKGAGAVVAIAPTMARTLAERGVEAEKLHVVYNWGAETTTEGIEERTASDTAGITRVLFAGNVGDMQDLETAVVAAHNARDAGIQLTIVGDGVALPRVRAIAAELGAANVHFRGRVASDVVTRFYQEADFALVSLRDLPVFRGTIPSKLQGALSRGVPVISTVQGDLRELVEEFGMGFSAEAEDVHSLEAAFRSAAACTGERLLELKQNAREAYRSRFSRSAGIDAIESLLQVVASSVTHHGRREPR